MTDIRDRLKQQIAHLDREQRRLTRLLQYLAIHQAASSSTPEHALAIAFRRKTPVDV
jgi:hypothetical protein